MSKSASEVTPHLPQLRRYARALTGSQERGDRYVRVCLEAILAEPDLVEADGDVRRALFSAFNAIWLTIPFAEEEPSTSPPPGPESLVGRLRALPPLEREALLLATLCEFPINDIASILGVSQAQAEEHLSRARSSLDRQTTTDVLIIEDEPVIAFDIANIVSGMGHRVVGIAETRDSAVSQAKARRPGVVLADIQLRDGGSGIAAAAEIVGSIDAPVIFVTAYPERLLTGERPEPTWLVTKPFERETLRVTISQALLLHPRSTAPAR